MMKDYLWNEDKNRQLKQQRGVCFEEVFEAINNGRLIDTIKNPNSDRYPNQSTFVINLRGYVYCVPFVESESTIFLKTIFPNRKMKKRYFGE